MIHIIKLNRFCLILRVSTWDLDFLDQIGPFGPDFFREELGGGGEPGGDPPPMPLELTLLRGPIQKLQNSKKL